MTRLAKQTVMISSVQISINLPTKTYTCIPTLGEAWNGHVQTRSLKCHVPINIIDLHQPFHMPSHKLFVIMAFITNMPYHSHHLFVDQLKVGTNNVFTKIRLVKDSQLAILKTRLNYLTWVKKITSHTTLVFCELKLITAFNPKKINYHKRPQTSYDPTKKSRTDCIYFPVFSYEVILFNIDSFCCHSLRRWWTDLRRTVVTLLWLRPKLRSC